MISPSISDLYGQIMMGEVLSECLGFSDFVKSDLKQGGKVDIVVRVLSFLEKNRYHKQIARV